MAGKMNALRNKLLTSSRYRDLSKLYSLSAIIKRWPSHQLRTLSHAQSGAEPAGASRPNPGLSHSHNNCNNDHDRSGQAGAFVAVAGCGFLAALWYFWRLQTDMRAYCKQHEIPPLTYEPGSVVKGKPDRKSVV